MTKKEEHVQRFKKIYEAKTGRKISDLEALGYFEKLVVLTHAVHRPILKRYMEETRCPSCGEEIEFRHFKNSTSKEEFEVSGLCQDCQDLTF
jgi:hypothetical protein